MNCGHKLTRLGKNTHSNLYQFFYATQAQVARAVNAVEANKSDDSKKSVLLFPGQPEQFVGMGRELVKEVKSTRLLYEKASDILQFDLLKLCLEGPEEKLFSHEYGDAAVYVTSLATVEAVWSRAPDMVKNCIGTAGFSMGELTALTFAGVFSFEDGLRLVRERAKAMAEAAQLEGSPSGMMAVFYGKQAKIAKACVEAELYIASPSIRSPVCRVGANLYAGAKIVSGHVEGLDYIATNREKFGIRSVKRLPVTGGYHTPIMEMAQDKLSEVLSRISVERPRIPVHSGAWPIVYTKPGHVRSRLARQMSTNVSWEQVMNRLFYYENPDLFPTVVVCGPGNTLVDILKIVNTKVARRVVNVKV